MFFLKSPCFLHIKNVSNLISGSSVFSKYSLHIWKFSGHVLLKPSLKDFEHNLGSMWNEHNCSFEHSLALPFFGIGIKTILSSPGATAEFSKFADNIECSTLIASSLRIWNSSAGIPSPPLALFVVMLPKVHLTSHSRMSGSRWVVTPSWLSGSLRPFLYSASMYSCHLFLSSSASFKSLSSVLYCAHLCMKCFLGISNFLEEISGLSYSIIFLYFFVWSLRKVFLSLLVTLWNSAFRWVYLSFSPLPFSAICKASSDNHLAFLKWKIFFKSWVKHT